MLSSATVFLCCPFMSRKWTILHKHVCNFCVKIDHHSVWYIFAFGFFLWMWLPFNILRHPIGCRAGPAGHETRKETLRSSGSAEWAWPDPWRRRHFPTYELWLVMVGLHGSSAINQSFFEVPYLEKRPLKPSSILKLTSRNSWDAFLFFRSGSMSEFLRPAATELLPWGLRDDELQGVVYL